MSSKLVAGGRARTTAGAWRRAAAACLGLAVAATAAPASAEIESAVGAAASSPQAQPVDTARFDGFVREVGIDISSVPGELRREWASAPRVGVDDCGTIPGATGEHGHGDALADHPHEHPSGVQVQADR